MPATKEKPFRLIKIDSNPIALMHEGESILIRAEHSYGDCTGCFFFKGFCQALQHRNITCLARYRKDKCQVIFKKVL